MNLLPAFTGTPEPGNVYHMDALTLLKALPDASVDAVISDPPYGCGTQVSARRSPDERFEEIPGIDEIYLEWIREAHRATKDGGAIYLFAKWVNFGEWMRGLLSAGYIVKNCIVWDKMQHGTGDLNGSYAPQHEFIIFATKGRHLLMGKRMADIIKYPKVQPLALIHPYEKPIGLLEKLMLASTTDNALILDPFAGSGTTLLAARNLNRRFIGGDITLEYVDMARKRLAQPYTVNMFETLAATGD